MIARQRTWYGVGCLAAFVAVLVLVLTGGPLPRLDRAVANAFADTYGTTPYSLAKSYTGVVSPETDAVVLAVGAAFVSWRRRSLDPVRLALAVGVPTAVLVLALKVLVARPAPPALVTDSLRSFPSGHTAAVLTCAGTLALLARRRRTQILLLIAAALLTAVESVALVYDHFHWLSDTVGSALLSAALLLLVPPLIRRRE